MLTQTSLYASWGYKRKDHNSLLDVGYNTSKSIYNRLKKHKLRTPKRMIASFG